MGFDVDRSMLVLELGFPVSVDRVVVYGGGTVVVLMIIAAYRCWVEKYASSSI